MSNLLTALAAMQVLPAHDHSVDPNVPQISGADVAKYLQVQQYLAQNGTACFDQPQPGTRKAVDMFNDLVNPATKPLSYINGVCCPTGEANKAAELYAAALAYFNAGKAYYINETPVETAEPTVSEQLTEVIASLAALTSSVTSNTTQLDGIASDITQIQADILDLQSRMTIVEAG